MNLLRITILILMVLGSLQAFPRWSVQEDVSCGTCHQYQGGGAARNSYGKDFTRETLVFKDVAYPWIKEDSESSFSMGFDTRYMLIQESDRDLRKFPMQFAIYGALELGSFIAHAELNRLQDAFQVTGGLRYEGLPLESSVALQREMPAMGWRIDDHSLYSRGGNLTPLTFQAEGLPFTPFLEPPMFIELASAPLVGLELSGQVGQSFLSSTTVMNSGSLFYAGKASYRYAADFMIVQLGLGFLREDQLALTSSTVGLNILGATYLGEWSIISDWQLPDNRKMAVMQQLSYRLLPGVEIVGRYEFFDPDLDYISGQLERYSIGLDLIPIPGLELKFNYRDAAFTLPVEARDVNPQFLTQIHIFL